MAHVPVPLENQPWWELEIGQTHTKNKQEPNLCTVNISLNQSE